MTIRKNVSFVIVGLFSILGVGGLSVCIAQPKPAENPPKDAPKQEKPAGDKPAAAAAPKAEGGAESLALPGVEFSVPKGWVKDQIPASPMAPQAIFKLPKAEGEADDGTVRVTHFPSMKGKDDMNIERWIGQVTKPDGKPFTKEEAKVTKSESGNLRITVLDLTGNVKMTGWNEAKPNHRMIAVIVDHPQGPHYVVAGGGVKTMEKWVKDFDAFIKSARVKKGE
ncbi:MAG: hypothetical protein HY287_17235 [Planctomycetes bacterium]|nr:hypothetical protein [Planctomycetota bacterium]MBI3836071.1 hypothetical protein [Planctomycetota bacterium]